MKCWMKRIGLVLLAFCPLILLPASKSIRNFKQFINCFDSIKSDNLSAGVDKKTALHYATRTPAVLYQLLNCKEADINVKGSSGQYLDYTPLHFAIENGDYLSTVLLLSYGADTSVKLKHKNLTADGTELLKYVESKIKQSSKNKEIFLITKVVITQFEAFKNGSSWIGDETPQASGGEICDAFLNYLAGTLLMDPEADNYAAIKTILTTFFDKIAGIDSDADKIVVRAIKKSLSYLLACCMLYKQKILAEGQKLDLAAIAIDESFSDKQLVSFLQEGDSKVGFSFQQKAQIKQAIKAYRGELIPDNYQYISGVISPVSVAIDIKKESILKQIVERAVLANEIVDNQTVLHRVVRSRLSVEKQLEIVKAFLPEASENLNQFKREHLAYKDRSDKTAYDYLKNNTDDTLKSLLQPPPTPSPSQGVEQIKPLQPVVTPTQQQQ